jgi:hypothetical protein
MTLKGWMLRRVNAMGKQSARDDSPRAIAGGPDEREPSVGSFVEHQTPSQKAEQLGAYGPLIAAIREELEHFVASQVRLHLAIAERDRYVLTSIEVECHGGEEQRELLRRFDREFKPEQIKHYLAKEVIAGLRNAGAIDLTQFAGLNAEREREEAQPDREGYGELISELQRGEPHAVARPYEVTLVGRWTELDPRQAAAKGERLAGPQTPLAGRTIAVDIEDAGGMRRIELDSIVPGRRHAVGKGEGCDIPVDGLYASRRHCEIWLERGALWVADSGSTNGIRVETANGAVTRSDAQTLAAGRAIEFPPGAKLVLSAHVRGDAKQYPRLVWHPVETDTSAKAGSGAVPSTPVTPIAAPRRREGALTITARMGSGSRSVDVAPGAFPFQVGCSRNQTLVIDWAHADVSGHHFDIVAVDDAGASVVVHGDNGVTVDGVAHAAGARFRWKLGETLTLGRGSGPAPACTLTLSRAP